MVYLTTWLLVCTLPFVSLTLQYHGVEVRTVCGMEGITCDTESTGSGSLGLCPTSTATGAGTGPSPAHAAPYMAPQQLLKAVVSAAVEALDEVINRPALSATYMARHHAICVLLGGGDHWKGLPRLSHVGRVVGYRSVVAEGA